MSGPVLKDAEVQAGTERQAGDFAERIRDVFPLTCAWCHHAAATHLLVYDPGWRAGPDRIQVLICGPCSRDRTRGAGAVVKSPASAWLFRLEPAAAPWLDRAHIADAVLEVPGLDGETDA